MSFRDVTFGNSEYDVWYLKHGAEHFDSPDFVRHHFGFFEQVLSLTKNDVLLEAGCGTGSYALECARRGYRITGMDVSPTFLNQAKSSRDSEALDVRFVEADYNNMDFDQEFTVIFFEGSFFYRSAEGLLALLRRLHRSLRPGGRLKFGQPNPAIASQRYPVAKWAEEESGIFVLEREEYDPRDTCLHCLWLKLDVNCGRHCRWAGVIKWLEPGQVMSCLQEAGFGPICFLKKREPEPFDLHIDDGYTVVAHRQ